MPWPHSDKAGAGGWAESKCVNGDYSSISESLPQGQVKQGWVNFLSRHHLGQIPQGWHEFGQAEGEEPDTGRDMGGDLGMPGLGAGVGMRGLF